MTDYITQVAVELTLLVFGVLYWTFRPHIDRWVDSKIHLTITPKQNNLTTRIVENIQQETKTIPQVVQPSIKNGIYHYENRTQLPFGDMISKTEQNIEISAITFTISTLSHYKILKDILSRKVHITFLLQSPNSPSISVQSQIYHASGDLEEQIPKSLEQLCKLKKEFKDLVNIRLYNSLSEYSIIIIDRDNPDRAWIQVESRLVGSDTNSRPIDVAYRKENEALINILLNILLS